jgi:hypothetical protein
LWVVYNIFLQIEHRMIEIPLTQGQFAIIDDEDFDLVNEYTWCAVWHAATQSYYARTAVRKPNGKYTLLGMHRLIMNAPKGMHVDHIDHNTLDNRREKLRVCTPSQNNCNRGANDNNLCGHKNVNWSMARNKWHAHISVNRKHIHLGYHVNIEDAIAAAKAGRLKYHGDFATD